MTQDDPFDFNNARVEFAELGAEVGQYVSGALKEPAGSRVRAIAALAAARLVLSHQTTQCLEPQTARAIDALTVELGRVEYALRDLEDGLRPVGLTEARSYGRPPDSNAAVDFQARALVVVELLQHLKDKPLSEDQAVAAVAELVPSTLLQEQPRTGERIGGKLTPREQLRAWRESFARKGSRRHGRIYELWFDIDVTNDGALRDFNEGQLLGWLKAEMARLFAK
jgi:hypothetical protein